MLIATRGHRLRTTSTAYGATTYRGATLPAGISISDLALTTSFYGTTYDTSTLAIGSSRYSASATLTVNTTGTQGRTDLLAHLATHAASGADHRIVVPASVLSGGIYTLPAKTDPTKHCWIVVTGINAGTFSTAIGTKIPTNQTGMATLEGPSSGVNAVVECADSASARGYSFHGIIVQPNGNNTVVLGIVTIRRTTAQTSINALPGRVFLDRCWIKGGTNGSIRRGILANGPYLKVHDSRITDVHTIGNESQGIAGYNGSQFIDVRRTTIEASSQAVLFGGADPDMPNTNTMDPADIFFEEIYGFSPLSWLPIHPTYASNNWLAKTKYELKNARRVVWNNMRARNNWFGGQNGYALLLQNLSDNNTNAAENRVEDVVIRNMHLDYCLQGANLLSRVAYNGGDLPTNRMKRVVIDNILQTRCGGIRGEPVKYLNNGDLGDYGAALQLLGDIQDLIIDRATHDGDQWLRLEGTGGTNWALTNQIARGGNYAFIRTGGPQALAGLQASCSTGLNFAGNVMYDYAQNGGSFAAYSPGCDANETNSSMAFQDFANYDYRLTTQQLTKGVSGGVPGADIATINSALAGVN